MLSQVSFMQCSWRMISRCDRNLSNLQEPVYIEMGDPRYRWGNPLRWGNPPVHTISYFNLIAFTWYVGWSYETLYGQAGWPPKRVTSPTWGPPSPCKQALKAAWKYIVRYSPNTGTHLVHRNLHFHLILLIQNFERKSVSPRLTLFLKCRN